MNRRSLWLLCVYCPGHARMKGNDRADRRASKATLTSGLPLGRSEVLRSLRHYLWAQSQGHHTIDHLEERGVERGGARRCSMKGREGMEKGSARWPFLNKLKEQERAIISKRQTELFQRHFGGSFWEMGWSTYGLFWTRRFHLEPDWTELNLNQLKCSVWVTGDQSLFCSNVKALLTLNQLKCSVWVTRDQPLFCLNVEAQPIAFEWWITPQSR